MPSNFTVNPFMVSVVSWNHNLKQAERFKGQVDKLKEDVAEMFNDQLELIAVLQRLGLGLSF